MIGFRSLLGVLVGTIAMSFLVPNLQYSIPELGFVKTSHGFSVMRHEVTIGQWRACFDDGGCSYQPASVAEVSDDYSVTGIGALDAQEFVNWSQQTIDPGLRLPTLAEWYVFSGVAPFRPKKIFTDPRLAWAATYGTEAKVDSALKPSGSFGVNAQGIADVKGNVWEWTSSCIAVMPATDKDRHCPGYFAAGEHEAKVPIFVRDPTSGGCATGTPPAHLGLRLVLGRS